jgi:class 3 adenylate cyclase
MRARDAVCGLQIGHGVTLQVRIGIATSLVVVGDLIGEGAAREQGVVGETPNLAARLQALAEPGQVVIAPSTRQLTGGGSSNTAIWEKTAQGLGRSNPGMAGTCRERGAKPV